MARVPKERRRHTREKKKAAKDRAGGPFALPSTMSLPFRPQGRKPVRHLQREVPDLAALGYEHAAEIQEWMDEAEKWAPLKVNDRNLNQSFREFIVINKYIHVWKARFEKRNPERTELTQHDIEGFYVRAAFWHWRSWELKPEDKELLEEYGYTNDENGLVQALLMVLREIFDDKFVMTPEAAIIAEDVEERRQRMADLGIIEEDYEARNSDDDQPFQDTSLPLGESDDDEE